jgi:hypothetical protein
MAGWLGGRGYWLVVGLLLVVLVGLAGVIGLNVVLPEIGRSGTDPVRPTPSATASPMALAPMLVPISADADCAGCHDAGGVIEVADVPPMAHPVKGWSDCTACHADDRLVATAPGHDTIHRAECLLCHREPAAGGSSLPRPHHVVAGTSCITCHGTKAPLPTDMAGRTNCWICHPDQASVSLFGTPAPGPTSP